MMHKAVRYYRWISCYSLLDILWFCFNSQLQLSIDVLTPDVFCFKLACGAVHVNINLLPQLRGSVLRKAADLINLTFAYPTVSAVYIHYAHQLIGTYKGKV